ncbi:hypothetical protein Y032_0206g1978 [Ancylostoma ceylanicum]|uniref:Uncharacterized protein n=2 Tax=Ancylostoma ceylanicum TaxID=53326 RepID=A0A016SM20_9BILA|nr:hypothetical protein Y032_0206g1978 [Ancylostoma ceylanicum]
MRGLGAGLLLATLSTLMPSSAGAAEGAKNCNEITSMSYFLAEKILELKFGGNWPLPVAWISLDFLPTYFLDFDFLGYLFQILSNGGDQQELLLCQLSESSTLLAQLGILVSEGLDRLMQNQGIAAIEEQSGEVDENGVEKRKHEYLRFGKRKHEYLRFGKRKHEYLRFGKRKHEYLRFGRK